MFPFAVKLGAVDPARLQRLEDALRARLGLAGRFPRGAGPRSWPAMTADVSIESWLTSTVTAARSSGKTMFVGGEAGHLAAVLENAMTVPPLDLDAEAVADPDAVLRGAPRSASDGRTRA